MQAQAKKWTIEGKLLYLFYNTIVALSQESAPEYIPWLRDFCNLDFCIFIATTQILQFISHSKARAIENLRNHSFNLHKMFSQNLALVGSLVIPDVAKLRFLL